jgi:hypothetical protein
MDGSDAVVHAGPSAATTSAAAASTTAASTTAASTTAAATSASQLTCGGGELRAVIERNAGKVANAVMRKKAVISPTASPGRPVKG